MPRVCRCGDIVEDKCPKCQPRPKQGKTAERGYDNRWRVLSERKRAVDPLCERCLDEGRTRPARHVHHIQPIATHPELRLVWDNLMSVCIKCHEELEQTAV